MERREFLTGIFAAFATPAVIRTAGILMPIKPLYDFGPNALKIINKKVKSLLEKGLITDYLFEIDATELTTKGIMDYTKLTIYENIMPIPNTNERVTFLSTRCRESTIGVEYPAFIGNYSTKPKREDFLRDSYRTIERIEAKHGLKSIYI